MLCGHHTHLEIFLSWSEVSEGQLIKFILKTNDDYEQRGKKLNLLSLERRRFLFDVLFPYKALNGYINIDLFLHMYIFSQILIGILYGEKMNVLLKRIMLELIHLSLVFFSRIVDMWNALPLPIRQATTIASFKKGVREFLDMEMFEVF